VPTLPENDVVTLQAAVRFEAESRVWAMDEAILRRLAIRLDGRAISTATLAAVQAARGGNGNGNGNGRASVPAGGVAVVPLKGMLSPAPSLMSVLFGDGSSALDAFKASLQSAAADPDIKAIVMDVDSPGGYVDQIPELAAVIRAAGEQKPIVAVANTQAASAAYWLASQAHELIVTPSGEVGSIGVYQIHMDESQAMAAAGVVPTIIKAGQFKAEGNPYAPLDTDAAAQMQQSVDDYYGMFTADVGTGRQVSQDEVQSPTFGEGRSFTAKRAVRAGLADRVATLGDTITRLSSGRAVVKRAAPVSLNEARAALGMPGGDGALEVVPATPEGEPTTSPASAGESEPGDHVVTYSREDRDRLLDTLIANTPKEPAHASR